MNTKKIMLSILIAGSAMTMGASDKNNNALVFGKNESQFFVTDKTNEFLAPQIGHVGSNSADMLWNIKMTTLKKEMKNYFNKISNDYSEIHNQFNIIISAIDANRETLKNMKKEIKDLLEDATFHILWLEARTEKDCNNN